MLNFTQNKLQIQLYLNMRLQQQQQLRTTAVAASPMTNWLNAASTCHSQCTACNCRQQRLFATKCCNLCKEIQTLRDRSDQCNWQTAQLCIALPPSLSLSLPLSFSLTLSLSLAGVGYFLCCRKQFSMYFLNVAHKLLRTVRCVFVSFVSFVRFPAYFLACLCYNCNNNNSNYNKCHAFPAVVVAVAYVFIRFIHKYMLLYKRKYEKYFINSCLGGAPYAALLLRLRPWLLSL